MAELQNPDPLVEAVAKARKESSRRPDLKFPVGNLNQIGNHVYAFSGAFSASTSIQTLFNFTSGVDYIVATLTMTSPIAMTGDVVNGKTRGYQLDFNGQTVGLYKVDTYTEDMPSMIEAQILIPPFTGVILTCIDDSSSVNYSGTANITGEVYEP